MPTFTATLANWNNPTFWSSVNATAGDTLDLSALEAISINYDQATSVLTLDDGATAFTVGDAGASGTDATLGGGLLGFFSEWLTSDGSDVFAGDTDGETIVAGAGSDTIGGGTGDDFIVGDFAGGAYTFTGAVARDIAGRVVSSAGDVDGDGRDDLFIGAPQVDGGGVNSGGAYLVTAADLAAADAADGTVDGVIDLGNVSQQSTSYSFIGTEFADNAGLALSSAGDVDGDGRDDLFIGAPGADGGGSGSGEAYLITAADLAAADAADGTVDGVIDLDNVNEQSSSYQFIGTEASDGASTSLSSAGDVDGDGRDDLIIGALGADGGGSGSGEAYLITAANLAAADAADGTVDGVIDLDNVNEQSSSYQFIGTEASDFAGRSVSSAGDVDGDGRDDLIIGADSADGGADRSGEAYLITSADLAAADAADGTVDGVIDLDNVNEQSSSYQFIGVETLDYAGFSVSSAGDVDGDGRDDLIIGANGIGDKGGAYLITSADLAAADAADGTADGVIDLDNVNEQSTSYQFIGAGVGDGAAWSISSAGDVDGDGRDDLIIGAPNADYGGVVDIGASYLITAADLAAADAADGTVDGVVDLGNVNEQSTSYQFIGADVDGDTGFSVSSAGDVDGDGRDDLIIGAPNADYGGVGDVGASYLITAAELEDLDIADGTLDHVIDLGFAAAAAKTGTAGDDALSGGIGHDTLVGGAGDDTLDGGTGDDSISGGDGDDVFVLEDGFGNDTLIGGDTGETAGDTLDMSALTVDTTVDLSSATAGSGTVSDGTDTASFSDIENITLGGGRDTIVLADGSGNETVSSFDMTDSGDGTTNDQLDVSGLTSDGTTPVTTDNLLVSDDGSGNAVITFVGGESITLTGVSTSQLNTPLKLAAIGIPIGDEGIVDGTALGELIDTNYLDDPEGDRIDNNDALDGSNDDYIDADGGNDTVVAGVGNDTVIGGTGDDVLSGGIGDDLLTGGAGNDIFTYAPGDGNDTISDFNTGNTGALKDGDSTNNDQIDLSSFYDNIWELQGDYDDDGLLNQSNATSIKGEAVDYSDNTSMAGGSIAFTGGVSDGSFFTTDNTLVACFTPGTRIRTDRGGKNVEDIRPGDLVKTRDNGYQPVRWAGARTLSGEELKQNPSLCPVLLRTGSLGGGAPKRDMIVSPHHRVLMASPAFEMLFGENEVLVAALYLVGRPGVERICPEEGVTYVHFMCDQHELVISNGAWTESFQPGDCALAGLEDNQRSELFTLFPELATKEGQGSYSAARMSLRKYEAALLE